MTRSGLASGMSILFTATTIGTSAARAWEIDSLRLGHDAVVGRDDEDGDVRHLRAAGAHGRERLVARRVEERDLPPVDLGLVGADVLRDPAGLGLDDRGLADRVQERRLAVVDVAHDRDDRRARRKILLGVLEDLRQLLLVGGVLDRDLAAQLGPDSSTSSSESDCVIWTIWPRPIMILIICAAGTPSACERSRTETPDGTVAGTGRRSDLLLLALRRRVGAAARLARVRAVVAALDHDTALPSGRALARPDRAVWLVRSVGHQRPIVEGVRPREPGSTETVRFRTRLNARAISRPLEAGEPPAGVDAAAGSVRP